MPLGYLKDVALQVTRALPNAATTVKPAAGLDIGPITSQGQFAPCIEGELLLEAPALTVTELPNAATVIYDIIESANADLSSSTIVAKAAITQTGSGGAGAVAATFRHRPKIGSARYLGFQATGVAATLAATATGTMSYVS